MLLLMMMLILTVTLGRTYPTAYYAEDEAPEDSLFRVLQRLDLMSRLGSPASKPSADLPADEASPPLSRGSSRGGWWHPETLHPEMKRRNNLASYNLNSFGLRYGK
ncbi:metastasis-suppressor KiSS-1 [Astyanax mexicanus]|nr:metastasis-suppressor KiSS-1 [Astyanax mexicanus]KAG9260503.1 metastasis-suppressor KiSS-1 isoform X1 [Astyanax mexicanus]